jgi:regulator of replication initiation timing
MEPTIALTLAQIANTTIAAVKQAKDMVGQSKESTAVKEQLITIYDHVLELKEKISDFQDANHALEVENRELKERLAQKESIERRGEFGYFFKKGEDDPLCPKCYQEFDRVTYLSKVKSYSNGAIKRVCIVCHHHCYEREGQSLQHLPRSRSGWMGN